MLPPNTLAAARLVGTIALALGMIVMAGCSREAPIYNVSGTATYDGKPIVAGVVYFDPDPTKGGDGRQGVATIKDGKYTTAEDGRGIAPGPYVIRVIGFDGKAANEAPMGRALFSEVQMKKSIAAEDTDLPLEIPKKR